MSKFDFKAIKKYMAKKTNCKTFKITLNNEHHEKLFKGLIDFADDRNIKIIAREDETDQITMELLLSGDDFRNMIQLWRKVIIVAKEMEYDEDSVTVLPTVQQKQENDTTVRSVTDYVIDFLQTHSEQRYNSFYNDIKAIENREPNIKPKEYVAFLESEEIVKDIIKHVAGDIYDANMEKDIDKVFRKICKTKYNIKWDSRGCLNA